MKTLIFNKDRISHRMFDDSIIITMDLDKVTIGPLSNPDEYIWDMNSENVELIENVIKPLDWEGGKYRVAKDKRFILASIPESITSAQAKKALHRKNSSLNGQIKALLNQPGNEEAEIDWGNADRFHRDSPFILALASQIPLTDAEVDQLFIDGAAI